VLRRSKTGPAPSPSSRFAIATPRAGTGSDALRNSVTARISTSTVRIRSRGRATRASGTPPGGRRAQAAPPASTCACTSSAATTAPTSLPASRFLAATGTSPYQWLLRQRVLGAGQLLETADLPVDAVAARSGLQNAGNLRKHFARAVRTTPQAYRRAFRTRAPECR